MRTRYGWILLFGVTACWSDAPTEVSNDEVERKAFSTVSTEVSTVHAWLGLKTSDDVGTKFDLLVEMLRNGQVVATGQLDNVSGGSSGFNNSTLREITTAFDVADAFEAGDVLGIRISVRIAEGVPGHRSGTARLWYGENLANSRADIRIGSNTETMYLATGFALEATPGAGPRRTIDVKVDRAVGGNPFKPFGTWTTIPNVPPRVIDVATTFNYRTSVSSTAVPVLAQWSDGTILVAAYLPNSVSYNVTSPSPGTALKTPFGHTASRPTIWIPQSEPHPEMALGGYDRLRARTRDDVTYWDNGDFGCCGVSPGGFPLDPSVGFHWRGKHQVQVDLRTGLSFNSNLGVGHHDIYITPDYIYEVRYGTTNVVRRDRSGGATLTMPFLPDIHRDPSQLPGALTAEQGYVHATPDGGGTLIHFGPTGFAWSNAVPGISAPVITGQDLVVVGSHGPLGSFVRAYRLDDGSEAWNVPVSSMVSDLVVGDDGNLFVLLGAANTLFALDATTGALRKTYINVPAATEMILSNGTLFIVGPAELVAVTVDSQNYDPNSPWPVRFGDNQRTTNLPSGRVR